METKDSGQEYRRLVEHYSRMADGELEELAADYASLTDTARMALQAEIARRGLNIAPEDAGNRYGVDMEHAPEGIPSRNDNIELHELVTVARFKNLIEAEMARGALESAGIESYLLDSYGSVITWMSLTVIGEIMLQVRAEDAAVAFEILENPVSGESEDEE